MGMAEKIKKPEKAQMQKIDDRAAKEAAKATLQALAQTDPQKAAAVKVPSAVQNLQKPEEKALQAIPKVEAKAEATAPAAKPEAPKAEAAKVEPASEVKTVASKAEVKKEADPNKEFVDGIMTEMALKGASKKRLIKMLGEQFNFDKQKVMFKLKRALISERYAALHAEAGH